MTSLDTTYNSKFLILYPIENEANKQAHAEFQKTISQYDLPTLKEIAGIRVFESK